MKASRLFLGFTLVVLAAALAGLWQAFGPRPAPTQSVSLPTAEAPARRPKPSEPALTEPTEPGVRSVYPGGRPSAAARPQAPDSAPPAAAVRPTPSEPAPAPEPSEVATRPGLDAPADVPADGPAVDLNSASVEALNALGAGMIGKTIVANRPYGSPDDLIARRVLKRQDFEIIKPRVVAR